MRIRLKRILGIMFCLALVLGLMTELSMTVYADGSVSVSKVVLGQGRELKGAELTVTDENGNKIFESWTSGGSQHEIQNLEDGTYILTETSAPEGYEAAEAISFKIEDGKLVEDDNAHNGVVTMQDALKKTDVSINIIDAADGEKLIGAKLKVTMIKDIDGNEINNDIANWTSNGTIHKILGLNDGTYELIEEKAPLYYKIAEKITFIIEDGELVENENVSNGVVTMKDERVSYPLWVGNVQVTEQNKDDVLGDADGTGATVTYTPATTSNDGILTLNDANITSGFTVSGSTAAIYTTDNLTVTGSGSASNVEYGIHIKSEGSEKTLTLNGNFNLSGSKNGIYLFNKCNLIIEGGTIKTTGGTNGVFASQNSNVTINGGTISATGNGGENKWGYGLQIDGTLTVNDGTLNAIGGTNAAPGNGIGATNNLINGGTVTAKGATSALDKAPTLGSGITAGGSTFIDGKNAVAYEATNNSGYKWFSTPFTAYPLWVGGVQVTELNKDDVLGDADIGATVTYIPASAGNNSTLTLSGATIASGYINNDNKTVGVYYTGEEALNIALASGPINTIGSVDYGIYSTHNDAVTTITGTGKLTASGNLHGLLSGGSIKIKGGEVTVSETSSKYTAMEAPTIVIDGGTLNVTAADEGIGIAADAVSINGGTVTVVGSKQAIDGNVKNAIDCTGWTNTAGTSGKATIEISTDPGQLLSDYKKVQFPGLVRATVATAPTGRTLTSNGRAQELVTAGAAENGVMNYALGSSIEATSEYKAEIPKERSSGTYYIWYKVIGDASHNDTKPAYVTSTIRSRSGGGTSTFTVTFMVVNGAWDDGTIENIIRRSITSLSSSQIPSVGNMPDEGYMAGSWSPVPSTSISKNTTYIYTYAEKPLPSIITEPTGKDLTETGDEQELIIPGTATGGTMEYALGSSDGTYSSTIPKASAAGTYYVWYKVVGDEEHRSTDPTSIEITIKENTKPAATVTTAPERKDLTDTGEEQELVSAGEASGGTMEYALSITKPTSWSSSIPTATKAGTYYIWYRAKGDADHSNSAPQSIVVTVKYGANTLVYNGEEQNLVIPGSAEGGTMVYLLGTDDVTPPEGTWSETVPTGKDVGPYYIWYKVLGDENHNDTEPLCIKVTIVPDSEVELFEELIDTLPEDVTSDDEELVEALRTLYDDLDADQKKQIPEEDVKKLEMAEARIKELKEIDQAMADAVSALIDQLPDSENVKPENKTAVDVVQKQYDALTDKQKELIPKEKREKLEALKAALAGPSAEDQAIATQFTTAVNAVPGNIAGEGKGLVDEATAIYLTMTDAQKAIVKQETYDLYDEELAAFKAGRKFRSGDGYYRVLSNGDVTYHHHANKDITGVLVPNQVKKGKFFFKVIRVSDIAFRECNQLRWVIISKNVYVLGEKVFSKTPNLIKVRVLGTGFKSGKVTDAFVRDGKLTVKVPGGKVDEYRDLFTGEGGLDGVIIAA